MATITIEQDVNLRQLETELGVQGLHVCNYNGETTLEAPVSETKLKTALGKHKPDPKFKHPDDAKREAEATVETKRVDDLRKSAHAKLKAVGLTDDEIAAL
jgi:hypothetical protein